MCLQESGKADQVRIRFYFLGIIFVQFAASSASSRDLEAALHLNQFTLPVTSVSLQKRRIGYLIAKLMLMLVNLSTRRIRGIRPSQSLLSFISLNGVLSKQKPLPIWNALLPQLRDSVISSCHQGDALSIPSNGPCVAMCGEG